MRVQSSPLVLDPGIGQGVGEAGDREARRRGAIDDRRNDPGRQEGGGSEQADVPSETFRSRMLTKNTCRKCGPIFTAMMVS
jgi:hypothetical protein